MDLALWGNNIDSEVAEYFPEALRTNIYFTEIQGIKGTPELNNLLARNLAYRKHAEDMVPKQKMLVMFANAKDQNSDFAKIPHEICRDFILSRLSARDEMKCAHAAVSRPN